MDIREVEEYVKYQIANAPLRMYPYPHFFVENIFPADYYAEMLRNWPGEDRFQSIADTGRIRGNGYRERHVLSLMTMHAETTDWAGRAFWEEFARWFTGPEFLRFMVTHFMPQIVAGRPPIEKLAVSSDGLLVQDHTNYAIGPHTDAVHRLVSTLFYCPADDSQRHLGTSVYRPIPGSDVPVGINARHHPREKFLKIDTMPFLPNSMFGFVVGPKSYHGVDTIHDENVRRNLIVHYARLEKTEES